MGLFDSAVHLLQAARDIHSLRTPVPQGELPSRLTSQRLMQSRAITELGACTTSMGRLGSGEAVEALMPRGSRFQRQAKGQLIQECDP